MKQHRLILILVFTLLASSVLSGRTFELTDENCVRIAVIASTTARAVTSLGQQPAIQPDTSSVEDLVRAISADFAKSGCSNVSGRRDA